MDYQGNAKKSKEPEKSTAGKSVEKVVQGQVVIKKKSIATKFKDLFIEADFKSVAHYVVTDVFLPAARNTIVDASSKFIERMIYGESSVRRRGYGMGQRITYNNPVNRGYSSSPIPSSMRSNTSINVESRSSRQSTGDFILSSREEASLVLERMNDIIDTYEVVSVADLNDLVGFPTSHVDNKWGWTFLGDVQVRQVREGYLIDLPPAEPIG